MAHPEGFGQRLRVPYETDCAICASGIRPGSVVHPPITAASSPTGGLAAWCYAASGRQDAGWQRAGGLLGKLG